jgi:type VI secretion system secreted protein Hcp
MAAVDYFLKIDGVDGESTDDKHKGEIDVLSFSWGVTQTGTFQHGGGGGAGKVSMQDFNFTMKVNKASPKLFLACASGQHIKSATVIGRSTSGPVVEIASSALASQESSLNFLKLSFTDVLVSSYQEGGSEADVMDQASLRYASVTYEGVPGARVAVPPQTAGMVAFDPKTNEVVITESQGGLLMSGPGDERGGGGFTRGVAEYSLTDIAGVINAGLGALTLTVREVRQPTNSTGGTPPEDADEVRRTPPGPAKKLGRHDLYYYAADLELTAEDFWRKGRLLGSIQVDADADPAESTFDCSELVQWAVSQGSQSIGIRIQSAMDHSVSTEEEGDTPPPDPDSGPPFVINPAMFSLDLTLEMN